MSWKRPPPRVKQYEGAAPLAARAPMPMLPSIVSMLDDVPQAEPVHHQAPATVSEREYMGRVAAIGCLICRRLGYGLHAAEVHHVRTGQGGAQRASNFLTVPLCPSCHRGPKGIHGDKSLLSLARVTEMDLLAETIRELCQ